jgi:hypothetical protein
MVIVKKIGSDLKKMRKEFSNSIILNVTNDNLDRR